MPTLELNEEFDAGLGAYAISGGATLETVAPIQSLKSLRCRASVGTGFIKRTTAGLPTKEVFSFLYRHDAVPAGGAATIYNADTGGGKSFQLRVATNGKMQAILTGGGVAVDGPTLAVGTTYLVDGKCDCSTGTFTLDWQVATAAQTQATLVSSPSYFTFSRLGQSNAAPNYNYTVDAWRISRVPGDYPLGSPTVVALEILPPRIASVATVKATRPRFTGLEIRPARIASVSQPHKPSTSQPLPTPPADGYTGPRGFMLRTQHEDNTADWAAYPYADIIRCWIAWKNLEASYNTFTWRGIVNTLRYCIDNGKYTAISLSLGQDTPAWAKAVNPGGQLPTVHIYESPADKVGYNCPIPWSTELRNHWKRLMAQLETFLQTSYNGKQYRDVVAFATVSMAMTVGTEMTIGDAGDPRNTAAWSGTPEATRKSLVTAAWKSSLLDMKTLAPSVRPFIAIGTIWGDGRAGAKSVADYAAATWPDTIGDILMGPTDMRVDRPAADSYRAWATAADVGFSYCISKHVTPWAQSAGDTWWSAGPFNISTPAAIKKAWLDQAVTLYKSNVIEGQPDIITKYGLANWVRDTLGPAIKANALPRIIVAAKISSTATVGAPQALRRGSSKTSFPRPISGGAVLYPPTITTGASPGQISSTVYVSSCYTQTAISSPS